MSVAADLQGREDVVRLVRAFYARATTDPVIGFIFTEVARLDLEAHLPVMHDFWESVLFGAGAYRGNAMQRHLELNEKSPLRPEHFERWLALWEEAVDGLFAGERASAAKLRARAIAKAMQLRMGPAPLLAGIRTA